MAELRPAYLIHGDDHGAVAERRAGLRALAQSGAGAASVEILQGDDATPQSAALALACMTFAIGRRVIVVEGAERFREADVQEHLAGALANMPPDTTIAFFAREEGRSKAPAALHAAVQAAGGQVVAQATVKPWELPRWAREQGERLGIRLDAAAAKALVEQVGERQQRLLRELEKLALEADSLPVTLSAADVEERAAHSTVHRAFGLADALVGADAGAATAAYLRLRSQGERLPGLMYLMAQRVREAHALSARLEAGESAASVRRGLRMPPRAAERFVADVQRTDAGRLRRTLATLADLELDSRGGAPVRSSRGRLASLDEDTLVLAAIDSIAGAPRR